MLSAFSSLQFAVAQEIDNYLIWTNTTPSQFAGNSIAGQSTLDSEGNLYTIGVYFWKELAEDGSGQEYHYRNAFVAKYDTNGAIEWSYSIGNKLAFSFAGDIKVDLEGNIVYTVFFYDPEGLIYNVPIEGAAITKIDPAGNLIWIRDLSSMRLNTIGNGGIPGPSRMEIDSDNSILVYCSENESFLFPRPTDQGLYLKRYSSDGDLLMNTQISHEDNIETPLLGGLAINKSGEILITGRYHSHIKFGSLTLGDPSISFNGPIRIFVAKFDSTGELIWAKHMTKGSGTAFDILCDDFDNIYLTGVMSRYSAFDNLEITNQMNDYDGFLMMLNMSGNMAWVKLFNAARSQAITGLVKPYSIKETGNGDLYITGQSYENFSFENAIKPSKNFQAFVMKLSPAAEFEKVIISNYYQQIGSDYRYAVNSEIDENGNIYTMGHFREKIAFGCDTLKSEHEDIFVVKYSEFPPYGEVNISGPSIICDDANINLTASTSLIGSLTYRWELPPNVTIVESNSHASELKLNITKASNGQQINVVVSTGCYGYSSQFPYEIRTKASPGPAYILGPNTVCESAAAISIEAHGTYADSFVWTIPQGAIPVLANPSGSIIEISIMPEFSEGQISVRAHNECGDGMESSPHYIKLLKRPSSPKFVDAEDRLCNLGQKVKIEVSPVAAAETYIWDIPLNFAEEGIQSTQSTGIGLSVTTAGRGNISVIAANDCFESIPSTQSVLVVDPLTKPVIEVANCDTELISTSGDLSAWFFEDILFDQNKAIVKINKPGQYFAVVSNFCGSWQSNVVDVQPIPDGQPFLPNVITPNNDGKNDFLNFGLEIPGMALSIINRWGDEVFSSLNYTNKWSGEDLSGGTYFYYLSHECFLKPYQGWIQIIK